MKIAFGQAYFITNSKGGTEQYTYLLLKQLIALGHEVFVFTFADTQADFIYEGINVHQELKSKELNKHSFNDWITHINPNIYHQHTLTPEMDYDFMELAKDAGITTLITFHLASATCIRGSMILMGESKCDGKLDEIRCTKCYLQKQKFSLTSRVLIPYFIGLFTRIFPHKMLPVSFFVFHNKKKQLNRILSYSDKILVFSNWQYDALIRNDAIKNKIQKIDHPVSPEISQNLIPRPKDDIMRVGYVGRITEDKGLESVINSFITNKLENIELYIYAIFSDDDIVYADKLKSKTSQLSFIKWKTNFNISRYKEVDAIIVPSLVMETGPMVILEALQAQKIIIASDRVGNSDKLKNNPDAFLYKANSNGDLEKAVGSAKAHFNNRKEPFTSDLSSIEKCADEILITYKAARGRSI